MSPPPTLSTPVVIEAVSADTPAVGYPLVHEDIPALPGSSGDLLGRIRDLVGPHLGRSQLALHSEFVPTYSPKTKSLRHAISTAILESRGDQVLQGLIEHGMIIRTCLVYKGTHRLKESLSFSAFDPNQLVSASWDRVCKERLVDVRPTLFFIYEMPDKDSSDSNLFREVVLWTPTMTEIETMRGDFEIAKRNLVAGKYDQILKESSSKALHVRPKGKDSNDLSETAQGSFMMKSCFWINRHFLQNALSTAQVIADTR